MKAVQLHITNHLILMSKENRSHFWCFFTINPLNWCRFFSVKCKRMILMFLFVVTLAVNLSVLVTACSSHYGSAIEEFCLAKFKLDMEVLDQRQWCSWEDTVEWVRNITLWLMMVLLNPWSWLADTCSKQSLLNLMFSCVLVSFVVFYICIKMN